MPEFPDLELYRQALAARVVGTVLNETRLASPFLLRTVEPPLRAVTGRSVTAIRRLGKRIVLELSNSLFLVLHLMISGRLRWKARGAALPGKLGLAAFDFERGTLLITEAGSRKRAALHVVAGEQGLAAHDPGGLEPLGVTADELTARLTIENRTLKRALTDPRLLAAIGNAYSDEILHAARLSPLQLTRNLDSGEWARLHAAIVSTLGTWRDRLVAEAGDSWPERVTAFREGMAVHGRYRKPCPACGAPVQRIVYAEREANYCAGCQTGGKLLADRVLSRLMHSDWPRTWEELEAIRGRV